jgi:putative chitinase
MMVTELIAVHVQPTQAKAFAAHITAAFERFDIVSLEQRAGFLAQAMHESRDFTRLEENLYYTTAGRVQQIWPTRFPSLAQVEAVLRRPEVLANTVYSNLNGNGDFASGDGWRFRGRGLFQLTFRANYSAASQVLGRNYVAHPELVAQPEDAALTAAWFWASSGCNDLMARGEFDKTTRRINAGLAGYSERRSLFADIRSALQDFA